MSDPKILSPTEKIDRATKRLERERDALHEALTGCHERAWDAEQERDRYKAALRKIKWLCDPSLWREAVIRRVACEALAGMDDHE